MSPTTYKTINFELAAIEGACNMSKYDTVQLDPDQILYHTDILRQVISDENKQQDNKPPEEIDISSFADFLCFGKSLTKEQYKSIPGENAEGKAVFLLSLITDYKREKLG